jgi:NADH-quinone oxidoreductase subunit L
VDSLTLVLLATGAPLICFLICILALRPHPGAARVVALGGMGLSLFGSVTLLLQGPVEPLRFLWFSSGEIQLQFGFLLDGLSLLFAVAVALITFCVMLYSIGYMAGDPGTTRYFAMLSFFAWAMLSFVYAVDLLQVFIFWELVGLASFFLIGFWYEKPEANAAAKKAFLMTRVGDVGLLIGLLLILPLSNSFDLPHLLDPQAGLVRLALPATLTLITLLIFVGIVGKSAQFPLHTWLPDAMEGPTPVSALLHSATMVAAGVFLMARLHPLFMASEQTRTVVLCVATFTAILASTMAMVERDIKKVLAYSSISQLGFMLIGLGAGSLFAGVFHLVTHAVFKALLFLCSGVYIHHLATNDMEEIGRRGGRQLRLTTAALVIGSAALAGVPPLAGFFSKEEIFAQLGHGGLGPFAIGAFAAAFLTAYYTGRMVFLVVAPAQIEETSHDHHGDPQPWVMLAPIVLLALGALTLGFFSSSIAATLGVQLVHHSLVSMLPAIGVVALGGALAWFDFGRKSAPRRGFITRLAALETLFIRQWYVDDFYRTIVVRINTALAKTMHFIETRGLDAGFDRLGFNTLGLGALATRLQSGWVQIYTGGAVVLLGLVVAYFGLR